LSATIAKDSGEVTIKVDATDTGDEEPGEPGEPGEGTKPTINLPPKAIGGIAVPITGKVDPDAEVELWGAPMGFDAELEYIMMVKADHSGNYAFSRWIGQGWKFATQSNKVSSDTMEVRVQQNPVFVASSPMRGKLYLAVQGNPRGEKQTVIVQRWVNGSWVNTWRGVTGSNNLWKSSVNVAPRSVHALRAFVAGYTPEGLLPGFSALKRVTIK
jgi:hypothetical protein